MRWKLAMAGLAIAAVAAAAGTSALGAGAGPYAPKNCMTPRVKPNQIVFACADFGLYANKLHWSAWGSDGARGHGQLNEKVCNPSCAGGHIRRFAVKIRLKDVKKTKCGGKRVPMFQEAKLRFPHDAPRHAHRFRQQSLFCNP
jgi:hypothetical protein